MWFVAHEASGIGTVVPIICEPEGAEVTVNSAEIFINYEWREINYHSARHCVNQLYLIFNTLDVVTDHGKSYLMKMDAKIDYGQEG